MIDPLIALRAHVASACRDLFGESPTDLAIHRSKHADYQTDVAIALAKRLGRDVREIAGMIAEHLVQGDVLEWATVSGPGFVNLTLTTGYLASQLAQMRDDDHLGIDVSKHPDTVVIDYSSPNLAKEMHVGHLRSTIIGDALARIFEFLGHTIIRQNHIGDWGTPFGMLVEYMHEGAHSVGDPSDFYRLSDFYRAARVKFDSDPDFADRARARVVLLQSGDANTLKLWQRLIDLTLAHIEFLYAKLGVTLKPVDIVGESYFNRDLPGIVADLQYRKLAETDNGAVCIFPPGFTGRDGAPLPLIIQKQDGGYGYATTDLAALRYRVHTLHANRVIYVVGSPQRQHLAMVFAAAKMAGYADTETQLDHVAFGSVLGADKKMLKSRSGEAISLDALLTEAIDRARKTVEKKSQGLSEQEKSEIASAVGIGAVKYADLVPDRIKDYVFDWDRMLAFEGNTAPYLMYAHARINSILEKVTKEVVHHGIVPDSGIEICAEDFDRIFASKNDLPNPSEAMIRAKERYNARLDAKISLETPQEHALALQLLQFPSVVSRITETLQLHGLCQYLFDLASTFTGFYDKCPVAQCEEPMLRTSRIALCSLTAKVLAKGLVLLGIEAPLHL